MCELCCFAVGSSLSKRVSDDIITAMKPLLRYISPVVCGAIALSYVNTPQSVTENNSSATNSAKSAAFIALEKANTQSGATSFSLISTAHADVIAPMAPPELSDTLTDFRTKEQINEQIYIEGKADPENSLNIPTVPGDLESKVMRMSANYQAQYEIAVPRNGTSIIRFYDLNGYPMEVVSTRLENQGFTAETTASPSELMIRQFQGASTTILQAKLKGINRNFIFTLKPLTLVNQTQSVRTLITSMTVPFYVEGNVYIQPEPVKFDQPNPNAKAINFDKVNQEHLTMDMIEAAAVVMPLSKGEEEKARKVLNEIVKEQRK